jgi:hypothetical protein
MLFTLLGLFYVVHRDTSSFLNVTVLSKIPTKSVMMSITYFTHVFVCVQVPTFKCTSTHIHTYKYPHSHVQVPTFTRRSTHIHTYKCPHSHVQVPTFTCTSTHIHMYKYPHSHVQVPTFTCISTHIHTYRVRQ